MIIYKRLIISVVVILLAIVPPSFAANLGDSKTWTQKSQSKVVSDQIEAMAYLQGICDTMIRLGVLPNKSPLPYGTYSDLLLSYIKSSQERIQQKTFVNFILMLNQHKFIAKDDKAIIKAMEWVRKQKE